MARSPRGARLASVALVLVVASVLACASKEDRAFARIEPELVAPIDGHELRKYPRTVALEWKRVPDAERYLVEVEMQNPNTGVWMPTPVSINRQIVYAERIFIEFPGDQPGRWRVTALSANDTKSRTTDWWHFTFLLPG